MSRELDAQVAEKVMGLKRADPTATGYNAYLSIDTKTWEESKEPIYFRPGGGYYSAPNYSTCIEDAFHVVQKMKPVFILERYPDGTWVCGTGDIGQGGAQLKWLEGKTAPEAICLAALKAVGA